MERAKKRGQTYMDTFVPRGKMEFAQEQQPYLEKTKLSYRSIQFEPTMFILENNADEP